MAGPRTDPSRAGFLARASHPARQSEGGGFFTALLPQFVSTEGGLLLQFAVLGLTSVCVEFAILLAYGWTAERGARLLGERAATRLERAGGIFLVFAGVGLAAADRRWPRRKIESYAVV